MISYNKISGLAAAYGSPFYLLHHHSFLDNYHRISAAFRHHYDKLIIGYSYKTNYIPYLCQLIKSAGGYAEVVSRMEYELALKIGQNPRKIIFNGPVKLFEDIECALLNNSMINLDSWGEIEHIQNCAQKHPQRQINLGLRINMGLSDSLGKSHRQNQLKIGRFGFSPDPANLKKIITALNNYDNINIVSLHGHSSTSDRSLWGFEVIADTLCNVAENYLPDSIDFINVGGGMFGYIPPEMQWTETPTFEEYAQAICNVLKANPWFNNKKPHLVIEPGVALAANALSFITKVIGTKTINDLLFVTVDGSACNTKPTFHSINQAHKIIQASAADKKACFNVVGSTCMEKDYLLNDVTDNMPQIGDYFMIENVGAYTVVLTPPFINVAPAIITEKNGDFFPVRHRQTFDNMFAPYIF